MAYYVFSGQVSSGVVLENYGWMYISSGGTATDTTVSNGGHVEVNSGGTADLTTVSAGGSMSVYTGGSADRPILSGGTLYVYSGGTATNVEWTPFSGMLRVSMGAYFTYATKCTGVYYGEGNVLVSQADVIENKNLYGWYNDIYVMSGGLAKNTTVGSGAALWIFDGGTASSTVINAHTTAYIFSGGSADDLKANGYGTVIVHSGGTATNLTVGYHYELCIAPGTYIQGTCGENAFEIADGVMSGGTMGSYGEIHVSSGGIAEDVTLYYGSDYSDSYVEMNVHSGGIASNITLKREDSYLRVSSGGRADSTSVESGGCLYVFGGTADHNTVHSRGNLYVYSGAVNDTTVESGGFFCIESGGRHMGRLTMAEGAIVSAYSGSILDFSLVGVSAGADALVNDLAIIQGSPTYWLTVNDTQSTGEFRLADGAAGFNKTITVKSTSGSELGYLTVGDDPVKIRKRWYSAGVTDGSLTLTIDPIIPENTPDLGWNDYVYDKKKSKEDPPQPELNPNELNETVLNDKTTEILLDKEDTINKDDKYFNFVGKGITKEGKERIDKADFAVLTLEYGARVSFDLEATDAAKFTVWSLSSSTKGETTTYKQTSLQSTKLKKVTNGGVTTYATQTKNLWLGPGEYCVSMESTNKKGGEAYYNVTVNKDETVKNYTILYSDGDGGWNDYVCDKKTKTLNPSAFMLMITDFKIAGIRNIEMDYEKPVAEGAPEVEGGWSSFVGFGDAADFARINPYYPADATFSVTATGASKFTVWSLTVKGTDSKTGNTLYTMKALKTVTLKKNATTGLFSAAINDLLLDRLSSTSDYYVGYYVSMQATNPKKDTCVYYNATVDNHAYWSADSGGNKYLYDKKKDPAKYNPNLYTNNLDPGAEHKKVYVDAKNTVDGGFYPGGGEYKSYSNFVGFGDEWDYAEISLSGPGTLSFTVDAYSEGLIEKASANLKFTVYSLEKVVNGGKVTWKQKTLLATQTITVDKQIGYVNEATIKKTVSVKEATSDDVKYFVSVQSVGAKKGASVYYNVWATLTSFDESALTMPETASDASALTMPETDNLGISDALSFGQYDADALADVSAFDKLASFNDASGWQTVAKLA